jgi:hypothetical protein
MSTHLHRKKVWPNNTNKNKIKLYLSQGFDGHKNTIKIFLKKTTKRKSKFGIQWEEGWSKSN